MKTGPPGCGEHNTYSPEKNLRFDRDISDLSKNSFQSPEGDIRTYLEPGELTSFFPGWQIIGRWEGLGPEHSHGDGPTERHGLAEAVLRR